MTILCYHAVDPGWESPMAVTPDHFGEQMRWLSRNRRLVDLAKAVQMTDEAGRLPRGVSALTFDDGFASVHEHALPILTRLELPAAVFVVAETLTPSGRAVDWVLDPPPDRPLRTLTAEQILEMRDGGFVVGSHGSSHRNLTLLSDRECERELKESRELLEAVLEVPVSFLSYPGGRHDRRVWRLAERAGFTHAFTLPERREPVGPFAVRRVGVYRGNTLPMFRLKATPWYLSARTSPIASAVVALVARNRGRA